MIKKFEFQYLNMETMWVLRKPADFNLPNVYQRIQIRSSNEFSGNNYSFVKPLVNIAEGISTFLIGQYLERVQEQSYPDSTDLQPRSFQYPSLFLFKVHISEDKVFCVGNNIEMIKEILSRHSDINQFFLESVDLNLLELGFQRGLIGVSGHKYTSEQGTLMNIVRKTDAVPFDAEDPHFECGEDIEKEYIEVLINFGGINKRFYIYADGRITYRGRNELETSPFSILKSVYDNILETIESVRGQN